MAADARPDATDTTDGGTTCVPSCGAATCGPDGCGGMCGSCTGNSICDNGSCCTYSRCHQVGAQCGTVDVQCGVTLNCGTCTNGGHCDDDNQCVIACGDGVLAPDQESCDDGNDVPGDGCENNCQFTCYVDDDCTDGDACSVSVCNQTTHRCEATSVTDGTTCGAGTCMAGECALSCTSTFVAGTGLTQLPSAANPARPAQVVFGQPGEPDLVLTPEGRLLRVAHDGTIMATADITLGANVDGPVNTATSLIRAETKYYLAYCSALVNSMNVARYAELVGTTLTNEKRVAVSGSSSSSTACYGVYPDGQFARNQLVWRFGSISGRLQARVTPGSESAVFANGSYETFGYQFFGPGSPMFSFEGGQGLKSAWSCCGFEPFDPLGKLIGGNENPPGIVRTAVYSSMLVYQHGAKLIGMWLFPNSNTMGTVHTLNNASGPFDRMQVLDRFETTVVHGSAFPVVWLKNGVLQLALIRDDVNGTGWIDPISIGAEGGVRSFDADADANGISIVWNTAAGSFYQHLTWCL